MPIRPATEADLPAILAIYNHAIATSTAIWIDTPVDLADRRAWFLLRQSQGYPVLVAEEGGAVLGYASFGDFRPYEGFRATVEHSVYLAGDARGRGLGTALVEALFPLARACGKRIMVGAVDATNEPRSSCTAGSASAMSAACREWARSSVARSTWCCCRRNWSEA